MQSGFGSGGLQTWPLGRSQGLPCAGSSQPCIRPTEGQSLWRWKRSWWRLCENIFNKWQKTSDGGSRSRKKQSEKQQRKSKVGGGGGGAPWWCRYPLQPMQDSYQTRHTLQPVEGTVPEQMFTQQPAGKWIFLKKMQPMKDPRWRRFSCRTAACGDPMLEHREGAAERNRFVLTLTPCLQHPQHHFWAGRWVGESGLKGWNWVWEKGPGKGVGLMSVFCFPLPKFVISLYFNWQ